MANIQNDLRKLTRINKGDDVRTVASNDRINAMQSLIRALVRGDNLVTNRNELRKRVSDGMMSLQSGAPRRKYPLQPTHPWQISVGEDNFVHVLPGTINGLLPTNMFTPLGPISDIGTAYVGLQIFTDGIQPTTCFLFISTDPPNPPPWNINVAPFQFQVLLGLTVNTGPFNVIDGLLQATPEVVIQTLSQSLAPGRPYYDNNYSWIVTQY